MADETTDEDIKALSATLKLKPYRADPSFLSQAGQMISAQAAAQPINNRGDYMQGLAFKLAASLLGGAGQEEERAETQQAYGRLAQAMNSKDPGLAISRDPYWYDAAPSFMLDTYSRRGKIADKTETEKMITGEKYRRDYRNVDPDTQEVTYFPGFAEEEQRLKEAERTGTLTADLEYAPQIERAANVERLDLARKKQNIENPPIQMSPEGTPILTPKQLKEAEDEATKMYSSDAQVQEFPKVDDAFRAVLASYHDKGPASDLSWYYNVIKTLDPNAVREGEMGLVRASGGLAQRLAADLNRMIRNKESLDPTKRQSLLAVAQRQRDARLRDVMDFRSGVERKAKGRGVADMGNVFLRSPPTPSEELYAEYGLTAPMAAYRQKYATPPGAAPSPTPNPMPTPPLGGGQRPGPTPLPGEKPSEFAARILRGAQP